jgi:hypothetical protein
MQRLVPTVTSVEFGFGYGASKGPRAVHLVLTTLPSLYMKCVVCVKPGASGCDVIPSSRRIYTVECDSAADAHTLKQLTADA